MIRVLLFLFVCISLTGVSSFATDSVSVQSCFQKNKNLAVSKELWVDSQWTRLGHYREGLFSPHSEVDSQLFFLAKDGYDSPKSELFATIKNFCENKTLSPDSGAVKKIQARCQFPARESYLKKHGLAGWPEPQCAQLDEWKSRIGGSRAYLVFSSYYANNPSSTFGHTLLRFDRKLGDGDKLYSPLLSYGVNFAGQTTTTNGALYALMGMTGGFEGKFTSLPYYYKVREYSDFDSRDLWEFELNLSPKQIQLLLNHIWEQGFAHYNYYYFTENCSYHLLTTLDVVVPEYKLDTKVPYWVIPIDTVKAVTLQSPGLIKGVGFRPSLYRKFLERLRILKEKNLEDVFYKYIETTAFTKADLSDEQKALIMDTVLDYQDFKSSKELMEPDSAASKQKMIYLGERSKLPVTPKLVIDASSVYRPDVSHETLRLTAGGGSSSELGNFYDLDLRFALHDLLDLSKGYPETAKIEFFRFKATYFEDIEKVKVTEVKIFDLQLLSPLKSYQKSLSWRALITADRTNLDCNFCLTPRVKMQGGGTFGLLDDHILVYTLAGVDIRYSDQFYNEDLKGSPVGTLGLVFRFPYDFNLGLEGDYIYNEMWDTSDGLFLNAELRKSVTMNWALGAKFQHENQDNFTNDTFQLATHFYF